jgi:hypothetical protein
MEMGFLENIRKWVDGVSEVSMPEPKPRYPAEEFLVMISREIDAVMQRELWRTPNGPTQLPSRFIVFFSGETGKTWVGPKRKAFEQTLINIISERARELSKNAPLAVKSFAVELREDNILNAGDIKVDPIWDEHEPEALPPTAPKELQQGAMETTLYIPTIETFAVEVWQSNNKIANFPFAKSEIAIGRGSQSDPVDLAINGYQDVSRVHAILKMDEETNTFWLTAKGRNPTLVSGKKISINKPVQITSRDKIEISNFILRLRPTNDKEVGQVFKR